MNDDLTVDEDLIVDRKCDEFENSLKAGEFPPSQAPGDWSLSTLEQQIKQMTSGGK